MSDSNVTVSWAIRWANGLVTAFDDNGEQMPELGGKYIDVKENVLARSDGYTRYSHGWWSEHVWDVNIRDW